MIIYRLFILFIVIQINALKKVRHMPWHPTMPHDDSTEYYIDGIKKRDWNQTNGRYNVFRIPELPYHNRQVSEPILENRNSFHYEQQPIDD